jgi:large subunit ribosomal protein L3
MVVQVLKVDAERGAIVIKGCIPGKSGNVLEITKAKIVGKNFVVDLNY